MNDVKYIFEKGAEDLQSRPPKFWRDYCCYQKQTKAEAIKTMFEDSLLTILGDERAEDFDEGEVRFECARYLNETLKYFDAKEKDVEIKMKAGELIRNLAEIFNHCSELDRLVLIKH